MREKWALPATFRAFAPEAPRLIRRFPSSDSRRLPTSARPAHLASTFRMFATLSAPSPCAIPWVTPLESLGPNVGRQGHGGNQKGAFPMGNAPKMVKAVLREVLLVRPTRRAPLAGAACALPRRAQPARSTRSRGPRGPRTRTAYAASRCWSCWPYWRSMSSMLMPPRSFRDSCWVSTLAFWLAESSPRVTCTSFS